MTDDDVPEVVTLESELFPLDAWPEKLFYEELALTEPSGAAAYPTHTYWVCQDGATSEIMGYAGMMCALPLADVQTLAVAPAAQGRGIGSHFLDLIGAESRARGAEDLLLEVRADNPGAQRLYRRTGFEQIRRRSHYYADAGDALIMRKHLRDPAPSTASNLRREQSKRS